MYRLEQQSPGVYLLPKTGGMRVPGLVIASEALLEEGDLEQPLAQVANVAYLPGIVGHSIAMPDIHWGYGFPIGGVAAMDAEEGVISPGGVGYDINCGVRVAVLPVPFKDIKEKARRDLLARMFSLVPSGVGRGQKGKKGLSDTDYRHIAEQGASWALKKGWGIGSDLDHTESHGVIAGGDADAVSPRAKERGKTQLGSIGSGNHFVEIGEVQKLHQDIWGLFEGQTYILVHCGSRGFGHQVCQDTLDLFIKRGFAEGLPDKQLVCAPIQSEEGRAYFAAMSAAANYAFCNRQLILHEVRQALQEVLGMQPEDVRLLYDVAHNIAKFEEHEGKKLCVHRKGATRAFGPGHEELAPIFQKTGQPVLVPGDMGRASYILAGLGNPLTFCSCCHGAGRARSRIKSLKSWKGRDPVGHMAKQGVEVMATSYRTIAEEMPDAYKNVDLVVDACEAAKLATRVARLKPSLVIKG